nr:uncharacterized protein LOC107448721 [Parasteatoda tepidariorum]
MPKFKLNKDGIVLYLSLFERQAKRTKVETIRLGVCFFMTLLPSEIVQMIARESEESFEDYNHIKAVLLKRFKMNAESFRKKFVLHQRSPDKSWRNFTFELTNYFQEWIDGLSVSDFDALKNLMIADQLKRRVPHEVREHFLDEWSKLISPAKLADRLDEYESIRNTHKRASKEKSPDKSRPRTPPIERPFRNRFPQNSSNHQKQQFPKTSRYEGPRRSFKPTCYSCGVEGHYSKTCPKNDNKRHYGPIAQSNLVLSSTTENEVNSSVLAVRITAPVSKQAKDCFDIDKLQMVSIKCGDQTLTVIIDSGAQISVVREGLVRDIHSDGEGVIEISSAFGESEMTPLRNFSMKLDDESHGNVTISCAVSKKLVNDLLLSIKAYEALKNNVQIHKMAIAEVISKQSSERPNEPEVQSLENSMSNISVINGVTKNGTERGNEKRAELIRLQKEDADLRNVWIWAKDNEKSYKIQNGILVHSETMFSKKVDQVVLPLSKRQEVLKMTLEIPLAGHLGERKTKQRIRYSFYCPTITHDVKAFCENCETCQLRRPITYRDRIPIQRS